MQNWPAAFRCTETTYVKNSVDVALLAMFRDKAMYDIGKSSKNSSAIVLRLMSLQTALRVQLYIMYNIYNIYNII